MTAGDDGRAPDVSVVIPHFEDARRLGLLLSALELDQGGGGVVEVIIADDGSATLPEPGPRPYPVRVVRQPDLGNRTGGARNAGARVARGRTLVFVDGDMVPEPGFLAAICEASDGQRVAVGRRRHADFSEFGVDDVLGWLSGRSAAPPVLDEPRWLAEGYEWTDGLRRSDPRNYRYVISALLACPRELFLRLGGFADELVGYGGEDWEFARRAWLAGADLRYADRAIGWHDGPDLAGRPEDLRRVKNAETLRIARLITDPALRGSGLYWEHPRVVVRCAPTGRSDLAAWIACAEGLLRAGDVGIWTGDGERWPVDDPRVRSGMPAASVTMRAELIVDLAAPLAITPEQLAAWAHDGPARGGALLSAASPRDLALATEPQTIAPPDRIGDDVQLEHWFAAAASERDTT